MLRILASPTPCIGLKGNIEYSTSYDGVTESITASNVEFESFGYLPDLPPIINMLSPNINMRLTGGAASWKIEGVDSHGCTYTGSESFTLTRDHNPSQLWLYFDLLPGSRRFLGYQGSVSMDSPLPEVSYSISCPGEETQHPKQYLGDFLILDGETPVKLDGSLSGNKTLTEGSIITRWVWNFTPVTK